MARARTTPEQAPNRLRSGQRFLHAVADRCPLLSAAPGVEARDLGLDDASGGVATARVLHFGSAGTVKLREADDLEFLFVGAGTGSIEGPGGATLTAGDAVALPPGRFVLQGSPGLQVLEVTSPALGAATSTR